MHLDMFPFMPYASMGILYVEYMDDDDDDDDDVVVSRVASVINFGKQLEPTAVAHNTQ